MVRPHEDWALGRWSLQWWYKLLIGPFLKEQFWIIAQQGEGSPFFFLILPVINYPAFRLEVFMPPRRFHPGNGASITLGTPGFGVFFLDRVDSGSSLPLKQWGLPGSSTAVIVGFWCSFWSEMEAYTRVYVYMDGIEWTLTHKLGYRIWKLPI